MSKNSLKMSTPAKKVLISGLIVIGVLFVGSFLVFPNLIGNQSVDTIAQAKTIADSYLQKRYPALEVDEIMEFSNQYYIRTVESSTDIGALELLIDRDSGRLYFEPGPNMMWNTKYGHMGRWSNMDVNMTINPSTAVLKAQVWLDNNFPGAIAEDPYTNYGYYTIDFMKDSTILGMLSVKGDTGEVWYHSWHGQFISEEEFS